ncbi:MAG: DUF2161 family putative PD-(D/E)XK-type phosphodiesterase [Pseudomonadota bacterium]
MSRLSETDLYAPVKALLEGQGYEVKGEIGMADIVAMRASEAPVIVELKCALSLSLIHQAIDRQSLTDAVYVAVPRKPGRAFAARMRNNVKLCRRLGLGLMTVRARDGHVDVHCDPAPYRPRPNKRRKDRLIREFSRLVGDPNTGGSTRKRLVTAYRQDALRCLSLLNQLGPTKAASVARETGVSAARRLMADNHYGWFERLKTGIYGVSACGQRALSDYAEEIVRINSATALELCDQDS